MALAPHWLQLTDGFGNSLPGATAEVRDTNNNLADLFVDEDGNTAAANPISPDATGLVEFFVAPGQYTVTAQIGASTTQTVTIFVTGRDNGVGNRIALGLGSASLSDTGPALNQVPTGQQEQDGVVRGTGVSANYHIGETVEGADLIPDGEVCYLLVQPVALVGTAINGVVQYGDSNRQTNVIRLMGDFRNVTEGMLCADYMGAGDNESRLMDPASLQTARVSFDGAEYWALKFVHDLAPRDAAQATFTGFRTPAPRLQFQPATAVTEIEVRPDALKRYVGRPGDSIGNNGSYHDPNGSLGDSTPLVLGPELDQVPTGQDLSDGLNRGAVSQNVGGARVKEPLPEPPNNTSHYLLLAEIGNAESWIAGDVLAMQSPVARLHSGCLHVRKKTEDGTGDMGLLLGDVTSGGGGGFESAPKLQTFTFEGETWLGVFIQSSSRPLRHGYFDGFRSGEAHQLTWVAEGDVSGVADFLSDSADMFFGRPGDSIGHNSSLHIDGPMNESIEVFIDEADDDTIKAV